MPETNNTTLPASDAGAFDLGMMLGSRKAFVSVAGRCSAADAECLRRVRDEKLYLSRAATWEEFCPKYLGLSRVHANRIIHYLEEFGPDYFEVAQLTRITPEQFRAIAPAIRDKEIHVHGQAIALIPENSGRVTAAVAELRRRALPAITDTPSVRERLAALDRRSDQLIAAFDELSGVSMSPEERSEVGSILARTMILLQALKPGQRQPHQPPI